jgi:hypothetical protein
MKSRARVVTRWFSFLYHNYGKRCRRGKSGEPEAKREVAEKDERREAEEQRYAKEVSMDGKSKS